MFNSNTLNEEIEFARIESETAKEELKSNLEKLNTILEFAIEFNELYQLNWQKEINNAQKFLKNLPIYEINQANKDDQHRLLYDFKAIATTSQQNSLDSSVVIQKLRFIFLQTNSMDNLQLSRKHKKTIKMILKSYKSERIKSVNSLNQWLINEKENLLFVKESHPDSADVLLQRINDQLKLIKESSQEKYISNLDIFNEDHSYYRDAKSK